MKSAGYFWKILRVNLSELSYHNEEPSPLDMKMFLGGNGFGTKVLWDEVGAEVDPLSISNKLIVSTGPFNGTLWPCSGRIEFISKSPLTGIYGDANASGFFGSELKRSGVDAVIIEGKAEEPVYLFLNDGKLEFRSAKRLWGKTTSQAEALITDELGDKNIKTACIGPAAENLVRFGLINCSYARHAARSGMGTVMGSKNLKAIAVKGNLKSIPAHDGKLFTAIAKKAVNLIKSNKFTKSLTDSGTAGIVTLMSEIGRLPTKNHQYGHFEFANDISAEAISKYIVKKKTCYQCPISCDKHIEVKDGEFAGVKISSLEYETLCSLGSQVFVNYLPAIFKFNELCDELGMDSISTGVSIAFLMELYEKGIVSRHDCDGLDLTWGNYHTVISLIKKIAYREGVGDLLADGVRVASKKIGGLAPQYAMEVKGQEIPCQDGRAQQSMGLAHVTASRGADHLKGFPTMDEVGYPEEAKARYGERYLPEIIDGTSYKYKAMLVKDGEEFCAVIDSLGICKFGTLFPPAIYWDILAEGLTALTGIGYAEDQLRLVGERIYNLQRCYNIRQGISKKDDCLPKRFTSEPSPSGRAKGNTVNLEYMLNEYYELRGWDKDNGFPTREKLEQLGLENIKF